MKFSAFFKLWLPFFLIVGFSHQAQGQKSEASNAASPKKATIEKGGKTQGYMGDPALKRGAELGYDAGVKAGKADKMEKKKANPTQNEDYKGADKKYRSEYGNRANFIRGYQIGFVRGYTVTFTGKPAPAGAFMTPETSVGKSTSSLPPNAPPSQPKRRKFNPEEDAL
jgi:hypothetical protein